MASRRKAAQFRGRFGTGIKVVFNPFIQDGELCTLPVVMDGDSWERIAGYHLQYASYGAIKITDNKTFVCPLGSFLCGYYGDTYVEGWEVHHIEYYLFNCLEALLHTSHQEHGRLEAHCRNEDEFKAMLSEYLGITLEELERLIHGLEVIARYCASLNLYRVEFSDDLDIAHKEIEEYADWTAFIIHSEKYTRRSRESD